MGEPRSIKALVIILRPAGQCETQLTSDTLLCRMTLLTHVLLVFSYVGFTSESRRAMDEGGAVFCNLYGRELG